MANFAVYCFVLLFTVHGFLQCSVTAHNSQRVVDVRLNGGSNSYSGILQLRSLTPPTDWQDFSCTNRIYYSGVLTVACRMLGFENVARYSRLTISNSGNFISINQNCRGVETDINDCSGSYSYTTLCRYRYDVVCSTCIIGAVRLIDGLIPVQGIVEICLNGSWSRVCGWNWGYQDSLVVCRQLGYPTTKLKYSFNDYFGTNTGYILSNFAYNCVGNESRLYDCNRVTYSTCVDQHSVGELRSVILTCMVQTPVTICTNGTIRLSGGRDQYEGRVEVCSNGIWMIISLRHWDSKDATVACRQLGLLQPHTLTRITMPSFSREVGSIYFGSLRCNGSENRLIDCENRIYSYQYSSAGVRCQFNPSSVHNFCNGDVRLVGGNSVSKGRVEICYNGVWGSVCNQGWNNIDAAIVCNQLGFQGDNSTAIHDLRYGEGSGPYLMSSVYCRGHERNLTECNYGNPQIGYHVCSSKQDAGVICDGRNATCDHGDVRLYGGYSKSDGLAEICINGKWTKICYHGGNEIIGIKFCRQLLGRENVVAPYSTCCSRDLSASLFSLHNVRCNSSSPARLVNCSYSISNSSCSRLIVGCYANDSCDNGSVRLVNGTTMSEGIVEVCLNGIWGNIIYSYRWNTPDAEVVCRQLGLLWRWSHYYYVNRKYDAYYSPNLLRYVNCVGDEDTLFNCTYSEVSSWSTHPPYSIAAVLCQGSANQSNNSNECISGEVRLANSSNNIEGRVEICTEGMWVSVCDRNWGTTETRIFCKQLLGHPAKALFRVTGGFYGTGNSSIISEVDCRYYDSFNSCTIIHQGGHCIHGREVGVICQDDSADSDYVITVTTITDPPFEPGSNLKLHCSISFDPSVGQAVRLYYYWRGNDGQFFQYSSSPNLTRLVTVTHYKESYYYCEVHFKGLIIGVGSILIQITDILNPIEVFSHNDGQSFNLSVNATDEIQFTARELNWYINGILATYSYYNVLTNGNKTLMTTVGSPGVYEVRYDGLLALPHNHECEEMLLSGMRHYPMFRPVRFLVDTTEKVVPLSSTITILSNNFENVFTNGDNITLRVLGQTSLSIQPRSIRITWFINGRRQASFSRGKVYGEIVRTNATYQFAGRYEVLLLWIIGYSQQCNQYYNSLRQQTLFDLYEVILAKSSIELKYYESLNHSFTTTKPSLSSSEVSLLSCSATIHYPPLTSISIVKNKIILKTTADTLLTVSTDSLGVSPFGSYQCRVNATGVVFTQQLTIKEKVSLRLELNIKQPLKCNKDAQDFVEVMESSIATKLNDDCSCNFTTDDLEDTLIECNSESSMIFTTLLVFSTESGDETASTLATRLSQQVSFSSLVIGINGSEAQITSACSDDCYQSTGRNNLDSVGIKIGVFFGGVIFSAVFTALCIKLFTIFRRKSLKKRSRLTVAKNGEGDVRYDTGRASAMKNIKSERNTNIMMFGENDSYVVNAENRMELTDDIYDTVEDTPQDNMDEVCQENLSYGVSKQRGNFLKFT